MPGRDSKGPMGEGPLTGRGLGNCKGSDRALAEEDQVIIRGQGRGLGRGLGRRLGRGLGRGFFGGRGRGGGRGRIND